MSKLSPEERSLLERAESVIESGLTQEEYDVKIFVNLFMSKVKDGLDELEEITGLGLDSSGQEILSEVLAVLVSGRIPESEWLKAVSEEAERRFWKETIFFKMSSCGDTVCCKCLTDVRFVHRRTGDDPFDYTCDECEAYEG